MKFLVCVVLFVFVLVPFVSVSSARADGCYICGSGSSEQCKNYCRHSGADTFAARKECEKRGCKVSGTASCPTAVNYKVCQAPAEDTSKTLASLLMCVAPKG